MCRDDLADKCNLQDTIRAAAMQTSMQHSKAQAQDVCIRCATPRCLLYTGHQMH